MAGVLDLGFILVMEVYGKGSVYGLELGVKVSVRDWDIVVG